jgi:HSP20 family protein
LAKQKAPVPNWSKLARKLLGDDFFEEIIEAKNEQVPFADVYQGKREVIVVVDLPGIEDPKLLDLRMDGDVLLIQGVFPSPYEAYEAAQLERKRGVFQKRVPLGEKVDEKKRVIRYRKGVLEIRFPRI